MFGFGIYIGWLIAASFLHYILYSIGLYDDVNVFKLMSIGVNGISLYILYTFTSFFVVMNVATWVILASFAIVMIVTMFIPSASRVFEFTENDNKVGTISGVYFASLLIYWAMMV